MEKSSEQTLGFNPAALFSSPIRIRILAACDQAEVTPKEFARKEKLSLPRVNYHFRELAEAAWLYVTRTEKAGGAERVFYRARYQGFVSDEEFEKLPFKKRRELTLATVEDVFDQTISAVWAGTIDRRPDSHVTWEAAELDEQGYGEVMRVLMATFLALRQIKEEATRRLGEGRGRAVYTSWVLMGFESPKGFKKKFLARFRKPRI